MTVETSNVIIIISVLNKQYRAVKTGRFIALLMEAVSTSETSVNFYQTTQPNNPEDSHLHTRHRENIKSQ
jgi:hypothetical protein